ncbi:MAG TPA: hypothetical protein VGE25_08010 [Sediminibacterium sp.]
MKVSFNQIFNISNGMVTPKVVVHINGVTMSPGVSFGGGVMFGGVDLTKFIGKDFEVEVSNGVYVIKGVYQ